MPDGCRMTRCICNSIIFNVILLLLSLTPWAWAGTAEGPEEKLPPFFRQAEQAISWIGTGDGVPGNSPDGAAGGAPAALSPASGPAPAGGPTPGVTIEVRRDNPPPAIRPGFDWNSAFRQSLLFLGGTHAVRIMFQPKTRNELPGPFWSDYIDSVKGLRGWRDGDSGFTNYILHPMMGAVAGYIQVQNDPAGRSLEFSNSQAYRSSRMKALLWSAMYSFQFELGPFSEASIGNVGLKPADDSAHPMAGVDLVVTPVIGTAWLIGEDALDAYVIDKYETGSPGNLSRIFVRTALNPCHSVANLLRFKKPWQRDH